MNSYTHLYVHGGPGFNSCAEERLLGPSLEKAGLRVYFWNEPSAARPGGDPYHPERPYTGLIDSLCVRIQTLTQASGGPLCLIAHSFAVYPVMEVARAMPECVRQIVLVNPSPDLFKSYQEVLGLAEADLLRAGHAAAAELSSLRAQSRTLFDEPMKAAFAIAAQDPELILNYWHNRERMDQFLDIWAETGSALDAEAFFGVLAELARKPLVSKTIAIPTIAVFGQHDRVEKLAASEPLLRKVFTHLEVVAFNESAHYPHIEETERFTKLCST